MRKLPKTAFMLLASCLLMGCAATMRPLQVLPPADAAAPCPKPPLITKKDANMGDLLKSAANLATLYGECARRHDALREWTGGLAK